MTPLLYQAKSLIRSSDNLREYMERNNGYRTPYVFEVKNDNKEVLFYGSDHIHDPKHPMFDDINQKLIKLYPDAILVEGRRGLTEDNAGYFQKEMALLSETESKKQGEATYVIKRAFEINSVVESPEPSIEEEISFVEQQGFKKEEIFAYYMLRLVRQWNDEKTNKTYFEYINNHRQRFEKGANWKGFDFSNENLIRIVESISGKRFDPTERALYHKLTTPSPWIKKHEVLPINEIAWTSTRLRDENILEYLYKYLQKFNKIFIIYGSGHAVKIEPAVKYLIENFQ
jgi:hypothetical protein